ncbi:hypothetical protein [Acinetobacter phage ABPH49]|nr:hypothetical protein [Acinetobacter phage ABPH49]
MKNYNELSDVQINRMVAGTLGFDEFGFGWVDGYDGMYQYMSKKGSEWRSMLPDYCNNIAYGAELAFNEKITIMFDGGINPIAGTVDSVGQCFEVSFEHLIEDKNPLRAAMIVYLLKKRVLL